MVVPRVCIVGGGISGLVMAQTLRSASRSSGKSVRIVMLEATKRLGGQIKTETHSVERTGESVTIETGAEGFVSRSVLLPKIASYAGIAESDLVKQERIADKEVSWDESTGMWQINELDPGVAAEKLGFQVPPEDRGRGIRTFNKGMSQLVKAIEPHVDEIHFGAEVLGTRLGASELQIAYRQNGSMFTIGAEWVALSTPWAVTQAVLPDEVNGPSHIISHHDHVSIHILVHNQSTRIHPTSFTVPEDLQASFGGLRAVSFVNEKFPGRCASRSWLFRCYYRPRPEDLIDDSSVWESNAKHVLKAVFGISDFVWTHYAPWKQTLAILSKDHLEMCGYTKKLVAEKCRNQLFLIGSEVSGAGIEAAASSGYEAALNILSRI